ncbi:MAG: glutamate-1-semialdehyde 2,1-aminomutase [Phycisphaerae bacterium]|nr:glutamate-1-semialdehyde 2,1-aminomutase [Phycisphaerae bacterium]
MASNRKSETLLTKANRVLVGGVNSPVRAFAAVGGVPPFIAKGKGATLTDADGNHYIDYVGGYGPMILGHAHERVMTAITKAVHKGASFGAPTESEVKLAEAVAEAMPAIEAVRLVSSGTEAVMTALRLARGVTGRAKIVKTVGGYHGHADAMLVSAGSGALTLGVPSSPGVPAGAAADTVLVPYNDLSAAAAAMEQFAGQIAGMIVEPVAGNMGVVLPGEGYLQGLRELCDAHGAMLIFDEVMTGFRLAYGGAQQVYGVRPDITTLGKILGGGMPVGAVGGRRTLMNHLAPVGPVYQAGTLSGNPIAMAAGLATLAELQAEGFYESLEQASAQLAQGLLDAARAAGLADRVCLNRAASMMTLFFTPGPVRDHAAATAADPAAFATYFHAMLDAGVYLPPSQYEAFFLSAAHTQDDIHRTIDAAQHAMGLVAKTT